VEVKELSRWVPLLMGPAQTLTSDDLFVEGGAFLPVLVTAPRISPDLLLRVGDYQLIRSYWCKAHDPKERPRVLEPLYSSIETSIRAMPKSTEPEVMEERIAARISRMERLFAVDFTSAVKFKRRTPNAAPAAKVEAVGSKGQFKILNHPDAVPAKVLVDFPALLGCKRAMLSHAELDPKTPYRLWVVAVPIEDSEVALNGPVNDAFLTAQQPWLLAVDLRSGAIEHKINLPIATKRFAESAIPKTNKMYDLDQFVVGRIAFNDTHLLLTVVWRMNDKGRWTGTEDDWLSAGLLVNRESGAIEVLSKELSRISRDGTWSATGLGDSFYLVVSPPNRNAAEPSAESQELWQIKPSAPARMLTKLGRRPEESPFDSAERRITRLWIDSQKLLVGSQTHFEYYDPKSSAWTSAGSRAPKEWERKIIDDEHKANLAKVYRLNVPLPDGSRPNFLNYRMDHGVLQAGCLVADVAGRRQLGIPVRLDVPENYAMRFKVFSVLGNEQSPLEELEARDFLRTSMVVPSALAQTDQAIIITLNSNVQAQFSHDSSLFPYLWLIEKSAMVEGIKKARGAK
jgi:hypothetical protein